MSTTLESCWSCTAPLSQPPGSIGTGYAIIPGLEGAEHKICYNCAADREANLMVQTGRATLHLTSYEHLGDHVINWTGRLRFHVGSKWNGRHNMRCARVVTFVRFIGPDGKVWSGRHIGDYNDLVHCKRTKLRSVYA